MLAVLRGVLTVWRTSAVIMLIGLFLLGALGVGFFPVSPRRRRSLKQQILSNLSRLGLKVLGVKIDLIGRETPTDRGYLIVANHLSYLDILVIASLHQTAFVTSVEIRDTFGLGHLAKVAGCLFVERRSRENLNSEVEDLARCLESGENVTVFPEATSTNGDGVLPFKRAMFRSVEGKSIPVLPLALRYSTRRGMPLDQRSRDAIHWYGNMSFMPHLWRLCSLGQVFVRIEVLESLNINRPMCRRELAEHAYRVIAGAYASGAT